MNRFAIGVAWAAAAAMLSGPGGGLATEIGKAPRHYAPNGNFDASGQFTPQAAGFDIADVSSVEALARLPPNVMGLLWMGRCAGPDEKFRALASAAINHPKLFGFYLADDPDPSGRWNKICPSENLRAEADYVHALRRDAITFIALMNVGSFSAPAYDRSLAPETTHIDLFGIAPYPCRREWPRCDYTMIARFIEAARRDGVPASRIVPIYQTFGGGEWQTESGGAYRMPDPQEMRQMLKIWDELAPAPVFDFAYSWGVQRSDDALSASGPLKDVMKEHNLK